MKIQHFLFPHESSLMFLQYLSPSDLITPESPMSFCLPHSIVFLKTYLSFSGSPLWTDLLYPLRSQAYIAVARSPV